MAILFLDGFDHYNSILEKWDYHNSYNPSFPAGRFGGQAFSVGNDPGITYRSLNDTLTYYTTLIAGCAWYAGSGAASQGHTPFGFMRDGQEQFMVKLTANSHFSVYRQGTLIAEEGAVRPLYAWYYIELKVVFATGATGSYELRVNGATVLSAGSVQTAVTNANANQLFMSNAYAGTSYRDDLYVIDTSGGAPQNDFLGDIRVETLYPNGNGSSSMLVGSDGNSIDNYLLVDEHPADDDTTYVGSATINDKDTYNYDPLVSTTGTIYGVQTNVRAKKSDAGSRSIAPVLKSGANETVGANAVLSSSWLNITEQVFPTKPGGGAWTIADVNAAEFGVKVTA